MEHVFLAPPSLLGQMFAVCVDKWDDSEDTQLTLLDVRQRVGITC